MIKSISVLRILFFAILGLLLACKQQNRYSSTTKNKYPTADTLKKDIPLDKKGRPRSYYRNKGGVENKLGLNTLENGFDSLQIRIWYGYAFNDSSQLVILKKTNGSWKGDFFTLKYNLNNRRDSIESISKQVMSKEPRSGWQSFINKLLALHVLTLPDYQTIPDYYQGADGDAVIVEIASERLYRIYSYQAPGVHKDKHNEARNIEDILTLIEDEFGFYRLRKF
jgi:hypothetical protein